MYTDTVSVDVTPPGTDASFNCLKTSNNSFSNSCSLMVYYLGVDVSDYVSISCVTIVDGIYIGNRQRNTLYKIYINQQFIELKKYISNL
jgi:hypothetical protein